MKLLILLLSSLSVFQLNAQQLTDYELPNITVSETLVNSLTQTASVFKGKKNIDRPFKIQFYGQSIIAGVDVNNVKKQLLKAYPTASLEMLNNAIGGYQAPKLLKTAEYDLYPNYPDLIIFHVYGGIKNGELERIFSNIKTRLSSDVIIFDHHISNAGSVVGQQRLDKIQDSESVAIRDLALECGFGFIPVRDLWKEFLQLNPTLQLKDLLRDGVHPNDLGKSYLEWLILQHVIKAVNSNNKDYILTSNHVIEDKSATVAVDFTGNRIDLQPSEQHVGTQLEVFIDGIPVSQNNNLYAVSRPTSFPRQWWPAITNIRLNSDFSQVEQDWTLIFKNINREKETFEFTLIGSVSGSQGLGYSDKDFISNDGSIEIDALDIAIFPLDKNINSQDLENIEITFSVYPLFTSPILITDSKTIVLARLLENTSHTLSLKIDQGNLEDAYLRFYQPNAKK